MVKCRLTAFNILLSCCICLTVASVYTETSAGDVAVIRIKYRWASEVQPIVQSMLSPQGTVTVSKRINSLIVVDHPDAIQRVRAYLDHFDTPLEQVRIHVRFYEIRKTAKSSAATRAKASGDNWRASINDGKKDGIDVSSQDQRRHQMSYTEFFVFATEGRPAYIRAAKEIPYKGRHTTGGAELMFQKAESGFEVTPTVAGNLVHLRVVPRVVYDERRDAIVRFCGAQTEVTTSFGRWVEIKGTNSEAKEIIKEILSQAGSDTRHSMSMSLMVEKP